MAASALSIKDETIVTTTHSPQIASVGLPFLIVELSSVKILSEAKVNLTAFLRLIDEGFVSYLHIYCKNLSNFDLRARMFAPLDGVTEDPATGSANAALIGLLTHYQSDTDTEIKWHISQGAEIGRPSILDGHTVKENGKVTEVRIGGKSVLVSNGTLDL